jgi:GntR family transcriptional regulator
MFVNSGARSLLLKAERQKFLGEEWPRVRASIERLGLTATELLNGAAHPTQQPSLDEAQAKPAERNPAKKER